MLRQRFLSANISREYLSRDGWLFNDVRIHQAGQLEHVDLLLAVEYCFQRGVRFNLLLVLQIMFLDVLPKFLGQFSSWQRVGANDFSQRFIRLNRFHERAVWFTFFRHNCGIKYGLEGNQSQISWTSEGKHGQFYRPEKTSFASARLSWLPISYHRPSIG